jgi:hypothetical protein
VITTNSLVKIEPVAIYLNADTQKLAIIYDNKNKAGIYRWINTLNQKTYVGSSINLSLRFKSYFSISYLEREILKNQSLIYRALLKNGYSNFRLEILEYCDPDLVLEREQYYLNTLNLEYNILKTAGSLKGFKHSEATIEQIRKIKKESNRKQPEEERIRQVNSLLKGESTIVINRVTGESTSFISGREAAVFIGINQSALAKYISKQDFYLGRGFFVYKSFSNLDGIYASEAYKKSYYGYN